MRHSEKFNSISHLAGVAFAIAGLVFLLLRAARSDGNSRTIVSFSIYGATLIFLYLSSALYHSARGKARRMLRKFDHAAIYLFIAGTYTPFTLVTLRGVWGWSLFGVIWGLAVAGMLQDLLFSRRREQVSLVIYLLMGWLAAGAIKPLAEALPGAGLAGLVAGGLLYTLGAVFYALEKRISYSHEIFHLFVLAGSLCHYFTILLYIA